MYPCLGKKKTVVILGNGPSLLESIDSIRGRGHLVIGVNDSMFLGKFVNIGFFGDVRWYWYNVELFKKFPELILVSSGRHPEGWLKLPENVLLLDHKSGHGIWSKTKAVHFNRSSGAAAVNLAYHFGAKRVILLGFDMKQVDGKKNWFTRDWESENTKNMDYSKMIEPFYRIAEDAKKLGLEIVNCTAGSNLSMFPFRSLEEVL